MTVLVGSASLIGGHGTTIAWAPILAERFGLTNVMEIGVAAATLGLVIASLVGGPVAGLLIARYQLKGPDAAPSIGLGDNDVIEDDLNHITLLRTILVLNVAVLIGYTVDELLADLGFRLPLFVACLLSAIVLTNVVPRIMPTLFWPTRTRALALVSDLSLSIFLAMSLMSMQLWTLGGLGPSLLLNLALQTVAAIAYILFVVFPLMGRKLRRRGDCRRLQWHKPWGDADCHRQYDCHYQTARRGTMAFIILPLVSAFFIDIANAFAIAFSSIEQG